MPSLRRSSLRRATSRMPGGRSSGRAAGATRRRPTASCPPVRKGRTVATDEAGCYEGIDAFFGYRHVACNRSKFVFGETNRLEVVWSALKWFIRRTYDHVHAE